MKHTVTYNHQSQFIELIRDCQTYLSISDLSLNFLKGITPTYVESSCVEVINQACVTWDGIDFSNVKYQNSESSFAKGILNSDDLLLTMTGRGTLGRCNIFFPENDDITYIADSHISILRVNKTLVLPIIIAKFISLSDTQDEIYRNYVTGSTNQLDIVFSKIKNFKIPVPPMALQEEFAAIVSQTDKSKFDGFKSQFLEWFGDVEYIPLKNVCLRIGEYGSNTPATDYDGSVRYLRITDINDDGSLGNEIVSPSTIEEKYYLQTNDFVFARTGNTVGKTYLHTSGKMIYAGYLIRYKLDETCVLPKFLLAYTHTSLFWDWVSKMKKVGAQPNISAQQYNELPIPRAEIASQQRFVSIAEQADKSKFELKRAIEAIDKVIKSLING